MRDPFGSGNVEFVPIYVVSGGTAMRHATLGSCIFFLAVSSVFGQGIGVTQVEVFPGERILQGPANSQQLAVYAHFADGRKRDVTQLTAFQSSDDETATVNQKGLVQFAKPGEVVVYCRYLMMQPIRLTYIDPKPGVVWRRPPAHNFTDGHVFAKLEKLHMPPADICTDEAFIRRAYIDICGVLPTADEWRKFMKDDRPDKRARLIDELLERPEFADLWAYHFVKRLDLNPWRVEAKNGAAYLHSVRGRLANNIGLDRIVHDMLTGVDVVTDRGPVSYYSGMRSPTDFAETAARNFLGVRIECARCHQHPTGPWTPQDYQGFVAFFGQVRTQKIKAKVGQIEIVTLDKQREFVLPGMTQALPARFLDGTVPTIDKQQDRRIVFADHVVSPRNPLFARTLANKVWHHMHGRGLGLPEQVHELPSVSNESLLDALARELVAKKFDLKHLVRVIAHSRTYQLSSVPNEHNKMDKQHFSHAFARTMPLEVLGDAISQLIESPAIYEGMPRGTRAVQVLHGANEAFFISRPPRTTACEWQPEEDAAGFALHMIQDQELQRRIADRENRIERLIKQKREDNDLLEGVFLTAFGRLPKEQDLKMVTEHAKSTPNRRVLWEDIFWAVINTKEFVQRR